MPPPFSFFPKDVKEHLLGWRSSLSSPIKFTGPLYPVDVIDLLGDGSFWAQCPRIPSAGVQRGGFWELEKLLRT